MCIPGQAPEKLGHAIFGPNTAADKGKERALDEIHTPVLWPGLHSELSRTLSKSFSCGHILQSSLTSSAPQTILERFGYLLRVHLPLKTEGRFGSKPVHGIDDLDKC